MSHNKEQNLREIKSFVKRAGRVTTKQQRALDDLAENNVIEYNKDKKLNFVEIFANDNPVVFEIGFGMGSSLVEMAINNPEKNYLGIEVHKAGVGNVLYEIEQHNITNLNLMSDDAVEILKNMVLDNSLSCIQIYFPDPWHKKRHNKRRLVNAERLDLFAQKLNTFGVLHFATDWQPYADEVLEILEGREDYQNLYTAFAPRPEWRPMTKFEKRGLDLGHSVSDILFKKK